MGGEEKAGVDVSEGSTGTCAPPDILSSSVETQMEIVAGISTGSPFMDLTISLGTPEEIVDTRLKRGLEKSVKQLEN